MVFFVLQFFFLAIISCLLSFSPLVSFLHHFTFFLSALSHLVMFSLTFSFLLLLFPAPPSQVIIRHSVKTNNLLQPRLFPSQNGRCNNNTFIPGLFLESKLSREGHCALRLSLFNFRGVPRNQLFWIIEEEVRWCRGILCGKENWKSKRRSELQIKT